MTTSFYYFVIEGVLLIELLTICRRVIIMTFSFVYDPLVNTDNKVTFIQTNASSAEKEPI